MSSQNTVPKDSLTNLNRKFENNFADINGLLDKVIERNGKAADLAQTQVSEKSKNFQNVNPATNYSNPQSTNKPYEGPTQTYSYLTPRQESNYSYGQNYQSPNITIQGSNQGPKQNNYASPSYHGVDYLKTPNKPTNAYSNKSTAQSHNQEDSYDYSGGQYSSPYGETAKQGKPEFNQINKPTRVGDTSQEVVFETTYDDIKTTFHMSNNNLDNSPSDIKQNNHRGQSVPNVDHSANLNVSSNTDIFGEKSAKCRLPRTQKKEVISENLVEENLEQYERDLSYSNKYAPQEVLKTIEPSEDGKYFLVEPVKYQTPNRKASIEKSQDPIDQIIVLTSPAKEVKPEDKLVGIYQQVSEEYLDGTSYTGEKFLGLRQGKGTYYYHEGYRYEGTWHEDKMSGFGILWVNDDIKWYEGEWKDNSFHGRGIIYNITPEELDPEANYSSDLNQIGNGWVKYEGRFNNGSKHGFGTLFLTNGDSYTGTFNMDHVEGRGSYAKPEKKVIIAGSWEKNVLKMAF